MNIDQNFMWGVSDAVKRLRPGADFEITNTEFTQWRCPNGSTPPSWNEVIEQVEKDRELFEKLQYARDRAKEYPTLGEQLDMIWHAISDDKIQGKDSEWYTVIKSIKDKYPKQ